MKRGTAFDRRWITGSSGTGGTVVESEVGIGRSGRARNDYVRVAAGFGGLGGNWGATSGDRHPGSCIYGIRGPASSDLLKALLCTWNGVSYSDLSTERSRDLWGTISI